MKDDFDGQGAKFSHPDFTAAGEDRAKVALTGIRTYWVNTGTLCNIECAHCYIESSPTNDALSYLRADEVRDALDAVFDAGHPIEEIGFTGGEPFMNPHFPQMVEDALSRGVRVLILTNAMAPMMRPKPQEALQRLNALYPGQMTLRISLDHYLPAPHDAERGFGAFEKSLIGMRWLRDRGIAISVAGRGFTGETDAEMRAAYGELFARESFPIDANDPAQCVLFPEMDVTVDVPEITTACWDILGKSPNDVMCATSRMLVRHRGADRATHIACTLLPYEGEFDLGPDVPQVGEKVALNHRHCAKFCVLGGASCTA